MQSRSSSKTNQTLILKDEQTEQLKSEIQLLKQLTTQQVTEKMQKHTGQKLL